MRVLSSEVDWAVANSGAGVADVLQRLRAERDEMRSQVERLKNNAVEWVSVDVQLPDADITILFSTLNGETDVGFYDGNDWWNQNLRSVCAVTHWAELPAGPL